MSEVVEALHEICNAVKALNTGMGVVVSILVVFGMFALVKMYHDER